MLRTRRAQKASCHAIAVYKGSGGDIEVDYLEYRWRASGRAETRDKGQVCVVEFCSRLDSIPAKYHTNCRQRLIAPENDSEKTILFFVERRALGGD